MEQDLHEMTTAYQESDKRRKNTESALSEAQSRITEDTSKIQELSSQNTRMSVSVTVQLRFKSLYRICKLKMCCTITLHVFWVDFYESTFFSCSYKIECMCVIAVSNTRTQSENAALGTQLEDLDRKQSGTEKSAKNLNEQLEELREQLQEETRAKIAGSNKQKQLVDEVERLQGQLEDEEEAKASLQSKVVNLTHQVGVVSFIRST